MIFDETVAGLRPFYTELLGVEPAEKYLASARPGFRLTTVGEPTGACRFGGAPLLEPGTPWPSCRGFPLTFLAVLDLDRLRPWLGGVMPPGSGLVNFFYLDAQTSSAHDAAWDIEAALPIGDPSLGAVVRADPSRAVAAVIPELATPVDPVRWTAVPGVDFPDAPWDPALDGIVVDGTGSQWPPGVLSDRLQDVAAFPEPVITRGGTLPWGDFGFGRAHYTANPPMTPADAYSQVHLLGIEGNDQWYIGGDGGSLHFVIPPRALREGDFSRAVPALSLS